MLKMPVMFFFRLLNGAARRVILNTARVSRKNLSCGAARADLSRKSRCAV